MPFLIGISANVKSARKYLLHALKIFDEYRKIYVYAVSANCI